jgi:Zn/Cd-binding protein ZinT
MKLAQAAYDKKLTDYNDTYQSIQEYIGDMGLEEVMQKNRLQLKRTPSASGGSNTTSDQNAEQKAENERIKIERTVAQNEFKINRELSKWDTAKRAEVDKYIKQGYSAYEAINMVASGKKPEAIAKAQKDAKDAQEAAEGFKIMYDSAIAQGVTPEKAAQAAQNVINETYPHLTLGYPYM